MGELGKAREDRCELGVFRSGRGLSGFLGGGVLFLLLLLARLLVGGEGAQLEGVDAALLGHFVVQQGVDHPVAGGLHLGVEGIGSDDEAERVSVPIGLLPIDEDRVSSPLSDVPEMSLLGGAALHGLVVGVKVRVIVNLQGQRVEGGGDLETLVSNELSSKQGHRRTRAYLGADGVFHGRRGSHCRELSADRGEAEGVSAKHPGRV